MYLNKLTWLSSAIWEFCHPVVRILWPFSAWTVRRFASGRNASPTGRDTVSRKASARLRTAGVPVRPKCNCDGGRVCPGRPSIRLGPPSKPLGLPCRGRTSCTDLGFSVKIGKIFSRSRFRSTQNQPLRERRRNKLMSSMLTVCLLLAIFATVGCQITWWDDGWSIQRCGAGISSIRKWDVEVRVPAT